MSQQPAYKRILVKLSGEALMGELDYGISPDVMSRLALEIKEVIDLGRSNGGTIHFIVEQESYQGQAPLDAVKEDLAIMKGWGY